MRAIPVKIIWKSWKVTHHQTPTILKQKLKTYPHSKTPVVLDSLPNGEKKFAFHYIHIIFPEIALREIYRELDIGLTFLMECPYCLQHGLPVELDVQGGQVPLLFNGVLQVLVKVQFPTLHQDIQ